MPTFFQRPENALKRANEFIDVGKKQRALDALYDVIKSKKHRTWQKIHEPIMLKYLELCVELRKSHIAKEGLYQYKNICQQVNAKSLEDVVRKYIKLAESKTEEAKKEAHQVVVDIDDLDNPDTPESLLLKAVSGEDTQDRTDRSILTPWVKFLWESYRQCLDLLRNNSRVERLYQDIAQQAFKFCLEYSRKTEFRKLCDNLRTHLGHIHKHQNQQTAINLNNADSQAMHLETRLVQLESAISMELWQEAFKAVEDIHGLICLSKKPPKPSLMANYYQKLGLVFWKSGNALFHACTLHRVFHLSREQRKNLSQEELQRLASRVLCATLAVPIPPSRNAIDQLLETKETTVEKQRRLATLLMLNAPPTRQGLIKDLVKYNITQYVCPELQNLYQNLEVEFHPLRLYGRVEPSIKFISANDDLNQYMNAMENIIATRVLKQVSQVYQSIEFARMASLVPFTNHFRLERVIVESARNLDLQVRIDHRNKCLTFGTDLLVAQKEDVPEGPYIQSMPSEQIRNQLTNIAEVLNKAVNVLTPKDSQKKRDELRQKIVNNYQMTCLQDHARILKRRMIIESRKEELEHLNDQREREEHEQAEEIKRKAYENEMARLEREARERERQRKLEEHREIQKKHAMEKLEQLKKTDIGAKVLQNLDEDEFANLDVEDIMAKQLEQLEKEKKELNERLKNQEKKIDYFARAKRLEELPLLVDQYKKENVIKKEIWEKLEQDRIQGLVAERRLALATQERLSRMKADKDEFINRLKGQRKEQFKKKLAEFEEKYKEEKKKRLKERREQRREQRRKEWMDAKEEAEQRARDEALKREREEKERLEAEKMAEKQREYEEHMAKLDEQAAKQRAKEREIEEREAKRREEEATKKEDTGGAPKAWRPSFSRDGAPGWREREKQKMDKDVSPTKRPDVEDRPPRDEPEAWRGGPSRGGSEDTWRRGGDSGGSWRGSRDIREQPGFSRERGPPKDDRGPPRDDRDFRGPPREERDFRGPSREDRDLRGPPREDRDFRGPPREDRDFRGPPRGDRDFRGPPRDDRDFRGPPRDDRDFRGPPSRDDRDFRGPPRDDRDFRGPPREERGSGRDFGDSWRSGPRDDRGPPRDDAWRRGGDSERDRDGSRWGPSRGQGERSGPRGGDDRGPPQRESGGSWRRGGDSEKDRDGGQQSWRRDKGTPRKEERPRDGDDGWTTVRY